MFIHHHHSLVTLSSTLYSLVTEKASYNKLPEKRCLSYFSKFQSFKGGHECTMNIPHAVHPAMALNEVTTETVDGLIWKDRHIYVKWL
jgi:hypothetical protein